MKPNALAGRMKDMGLARPLTATELADSFEHYLNRAVAYGEGGIRTCTGLSRSVFTAIDAVADEYPNPTAQTVQAARDAFAAMMETID